MFADGEPFDVLEHEVLRLQFEHHAHEVVHQMIARIVKRPLADHGKALARGTTYDHVDVLFSQPGQASEFIACDVDKALANGRRVGEVELVGGAMYRVYVDGANHVETSLLEPQAKPTGTGKEINTDGTRHESSKKAGTGRTKL
jgi:hypothetical protein